MGSAFRSSFPHRSTRNPVTLNHLLRLKLGNRYLIKQLQGGNCASSRLVRGAGRCWWLEVLLSDMSSYKPRLTWGNLNYMIVVSTNRNKLLLTIQ